MSTTSVSLTTFELCPKLPPGTAGKASFKVKSNLYKVNLKDAADMVQYDIDFHPPLATVGARTEAFSSALASASKTKPQFSSFYSRIFFDGASLAFSIGSLSGYKDIGDTLVFTTPNPLYSFSQKEIDALIHLVSLPPTSTWDQVQTAVKAVNPDQSASAKSVTPGVIDSGGHGGRGGGRGGRSGGRGGKAVVSAPVQPAPADISAKSTPEEVRDFLKINQGKINKLLIKVSIKMVSTFSLSSVAAFLNSCQKRNAGGMTPSALPLTVLQGLDVILRGSLVKAQPISAGHTVLIHNKSVFSTAQKGIKVGQGISLLEGSFQSLRLLDAGLVFNVDTSYLPVLPSGPILEYLLEALNCRAEMDLVKRPAQVIAGLVSRIRVRATHGHRRKYTLFGFADTPASRHPIVLPDGSSITVVQYFKSQYGITLRFPNLPCGLVQKDNAIPLELLEIVPGQRYNSELSAEQRTALLDHAVRVPKEKFAQAAKMALPFQLPYSPNSKPGQVTGVLDPAASAMSVGAEPINTMARLLNSPSILSRSKGALKPLPTFAGTWRFDDRRAGQSQYVKSMNTGNTILIVSESSRCEDKLIRPLMDMLVSMGKDVGMTVTAPARIFRVKHAGECESQLLTAKPDFVFAILNKTDPCYAVIKRVCESQLGCISQCFDARKIFKLNPGYISNVLLKINAKLGGVNFEARVNTEKPTSPGPRPANSLGLPSLLLGDGAPGEGTMVMGTDVYHSTQGTGSENALSHASFVASQNVHASSYAGVVLQQGYRMELVPYENMKRAAGFLLKTFFEKTNLFPTRIIYLRDGDADQRSEQFIQQEAAAIVDAYASAFSTIARAPKRRPQLLMMTVVKRHHVRFNPLDEKNTGPAAGNGGNPIAGTVIDTIVTRPDVSEFYLYSHPGLKGTSRPTLYQVVINELGPNRSSASLDSIQELMFYLAHHHQRSTRSASLPAPVYYAHLMAYRTRLLDVTYGQATSTSSNKWPKGIHNAVTQKPFYL